MAVSAGLTAPLDTIRSGTGDIVARTVTGTGTIDYPQLAELIGPDVQKAVLDEARQLLANAQAECRQVLLDDHLLGAPGHQVGNDYLADGRVQVEELGEGAGELAGSDHAEREHL